MMNLQGTIIDSHVATYKLISAEIPYVNVQEN